MSQLWGGNFLEISDIYQDFHIVGVVFVRAIHCGSVYSIIILNPNMQCNLYWNLLKFAKLKDFQNDFFIKKFSAFTLLIRLVLDHTFIQKHGGGR